MPELGQQGINFEEQQPVTLIEAVSHILEQSSEPVTMAYLCGVVQKNLPQWKPQSVSPCVSNLIALGCAKEIRSFGVRFIAHTRLYDPETDRERLTQLDKQKRTPVVGSRTPVADTYSVSTPQGPMKILIAIGDTRTEAMTIAEAKALYQQLHALFGGGK